MKNEQLDFWIKQRKDQKRKSSVETLFNGLRSGNNSALSAAITLIESSLESDRILANELIKKCLPFSGNAIRIAITGIPGVGKSSFIEEFGKIIIGEKKRLSILAIDPSSIKSKGSILGDKTRMDFLSKSENVFIRPTATGNTLGGVARNTRESILLCEAANYNVIIVETVGVGQSEISAHSMVDFFLVLMLSGAGDELQGIKRGIMELADAILITKADGQNINPAKKAKQQIKNALHLFPAKENNWTPIVETCSSKDELNIHLAWEIINDFFTIQSNNGWINSNRIEQQIKAFNNTLQSKIYHDFLSKQRKHINRLENEIKQNKISPYQAVEKLLNKN